MTDLNLNVSSKVGLVCTRLGVYGLADSFSVL